MRGIPDETAESESSSNGEFSRSFDSSTTADDDEISLCSSQCDSPSHGSHAGTNILQLLADVEEDEEADDVNEEEEQEKVMKLMECTQAEDKYDDVNEEGDREEVMECTRALILRLSMDRFQIHRRQFEYQC